MEIDREVVDITKAVNAKSGDAIPIDAFIWQICLVRRGHKSYNLGEGWDRR